MGEMSSNSEYTAIGPGSSDWVGELVAWGAGLRAGQALIIGGKAMALLDGRSHVATSDIQKLAHPVLRHRILPNYRAEAEGVTTDQFVETIVGDLYGAPNKLQETDSA